MLRTFAYLHFSGISSSVLCSLGAEDLLEISVVCSFYGICNIFISLWQLFRGISIPSLFWRRRPLHELHQVGWLHEEAGHRHGRSHLDNT